MSAQGFSHKAQGGLCQDAVRVMRKKGYVIISVADGHGGERYFRSGKGSQRAVELAEREFESLLVDISKRHFWDGKINWETTVKALENKIVKEWQNAVEQDFQTHQLNENEKELAERLRLKFDGISEEDKERDEICGVKSHNSEILKCYGSTLLSALYIPTLKIGRQTESFWIVIQIGDGLTFALDEDGRDFYPVPEDKSLGFGYTTSLCSSNAAGSFRHAFGFSRLRALVVCSDGVADSFAKDSFGDFIRKIRANIAEYGAEAVQKELEEFFPRLSERGSCDDVSMGGMFEVDS